MSYKDDCKGTSESEFRVGMAGGGQRVFSVFNDFLARMLWTPTATRDIVVPDESGTIVLKNSGRINGLSPAIAPGQAATFEQLAGGSLYEGGLYVAIYPGSSSAFSAIGTQVTTSGTIQVGALNTTSNLTQTRRNVIVSAATAGALVYIRPPALMVWRGNAAGRGGFRLETRFGVEVLVAGYRHFVGISDSAANPTNVDPLTSTALNKVGLAVNTNTGNWQLINNVAGTAPTVLDLGASFPLNTTDGMMLVLAALPNAAGIDYTVRNRSTGASVSGTLTTNIPANTTFLAPMFWATNNATAAAITATHIFTTLTSPN